jgi:hypothetical protein
MSDEQERGQAEWLRLDWPPDLRPNIELLLDQLAEANRTISELRGYVDRLVAAGLASDAALRGTPEQEQP